MEIRCGTSGFSYPAWRGSFYPAGAKAGEFLALYAARLPAVEINNTFYRMPTPRLLAGWREQVPPGFVQDDYWSVPVPAGSGSPANGRPTWS